MVLDFKCFNDKTVYDIKWDMYTSKMQGIVG